MTELVKSEIARFGYWVGVGVCLHFALLLVLVKFGIYINAGQGLGILCSIVYSSGSILFGVIQIRSFRREGLWTFLINRPAPTYQLAACLVTAGMVVLVSVVVFPPIMVVVSLDWLTNSVVDLRHYLQSFFFLGLATSGYFAGCYLALSPSKGAVLVVALPIVIVASMTLNGSLLWICIAIIVWQVFLLASVFKPNLGSHPQLWSFRFANIAAFQLAAYFAMSMAAGVTVQAYLMLAYGAGVTTSWNDYFGQDTIERMESEDGREKLIRSLDGLDEERKAFLQKQITLCDVHQVQPISGVAISQQQMPFAQQSQHLLIDDSYNKIKWQFSHNQMAFVRGDRTSQNEPVNLEVLSQNQSIALTHVPVVVNDQVVTPTAVYSYDTDFKCLTMRFFVDDNGIRENETSNNERILSSIEKAGQRYVLLTTHALYFFESSVFTNQSGLIAPSVRIPLPHSHENLHSVDIAELLDADLISFLWGIHSEGGHYPAEQTTIRLASDGQVETLATRKLSNGFPATYRHSGFFVSPLIHTLRVCLVAPRARANSNRAAHRHGIPPMPLSLIVAIVLATMGSVAMTWWLSRDRIASRKSRWMWLAVVLATSLAGLLSFVLLNPKRPPVAMNNLGVSIS